MLFDKKSNEHLQVLLNINFIRTLQKCRYRHQQLLDNNNNRRNHITEQCENNNTSLRINRLTGAKTMPISRRARCESILRISTAAGIFNRLLDTTLESRVSSPASQIIVNHFVRRNPAANCDFYVNSTAHINQPAGSLTC